MALKTTVNVSTTYIIPAANIDMVFTRFTIPYLQQIYFQTKFYQNYETYVNTFEIMTFVFFYFLCSGLCSFTAILPEMLRIVPFVGKS